MEYLPKKIEMSKNNKQLKYQHYTKTQKNVEKK